MANTEAFAIIQKGCSMSEKLHTLETEIIEQVLTEQPDFKPILEDLAARYGLPAKHVVLLSNYLQKDLPPGVPAGADKLLDLCQQVKQGYYSITMENGELVLTRERDDIPEPEIPEPQWPSERQAGGQTEEQPEPSPAQTPQQTGLMPRSKKLSQAFTLLALCALAAAGYFLYRYMGH